jgi:hypothetical protein
MTDYTAEEIQRISQLVDKIAGLIHDHSHDEIISALASIYIGLWAGACCANHRKTMSDDLASDIPKMLEAANRRAATPHCVDCGRDTCSPDQHEWYMVHDDLWAAAGMLPEGGGCLCVGCLEKRIGHQLEPTDFTNAGINDPNGPHSARLRDRLQGKAVIAECERCGKKRLFKTKLKLDQLKGICPRCQNESAVERHLTFRAPTKIELETMAPDEELSRRMAEKHE